MNRFTLLTAALTLVAASCGGSSDPSSAATVGTVGLDTTTTAPATTTTTQPPTTTTTVAPTTTTSTTEAPAGIVPGEDPDVDAVVLAYQVAFDAESTYEEKAVFIDDPTDLEETVAKYLETGASVGGITVAVSAVTLNGDSADVVYDLLFAGNPTYPDLSGTAVSTPDGWKVPRTVFCSLMSAARVGCP